MMKNFILVSVLILLFAALAVADDWSVEFNEICSKVDIADSLSIEELQSLIEEADKLLVRIQASNDARKKVYIFRLKKCRSMFKYSIQLKQ